MFDAGVVSPTLERLEPPHLVPLGLRPDPERRQVAAFAVRVGVHADDDPLVGLQPALELESRIGDLPLKEPVFDAAQHTTLLVDPVEVPLRATLHLVG